MSWAACMGPLQVNRPAGVWLGEGPRQDYLF